MHMLGLRRYLMLLDSPEASAIVYLRPHCSQGATEVWAPRWVAGWHVQQEQHRATEKQQDSVRSKLDHSRRTPPNLSQLTGIVPRAKWVSVGRCAAIPTLPHPHLQRYVCSRTTPHATQPEQCSLTLLPAAGAAREPERRDGGDVAGDGSAAQRIVGQV